MEPWGTPASKLKGRLGYDQNNDPLFSETKEISDNIQNLI